MIRNIKFVFIITIAVLFSCNIFSCNKQNKIKFDTYEYAFKYFLDVPGITPEEIAAIELLQNETQSFSYGMILTTEAFPLGNGKVGGFSALFCEWLTELFAIPFHVKIFPSNEMNHMLTTGKVDFSGNTMFTEERSESLYMTDAIAERQFLTVRLGGSRSLDSISKERPLKFVFMENSPMESFIAAVTEQGSYEPVFVGSYTDAYEILKRGMADAVIATNATRISFIDYPDLILEDFFPVIFIPTSMATANEKLEPVISIVNKALRNGAASDLMRMYNQGYQDYMRFKVSSWLTDEEREFIAKYVNSNTPVPIIAYNSNYPLSFYNNREHEWQGIYFDILNEVNKLTGLSFEVAHDEKLNMPYLNDLLMDGRAFAIPEFVRTTEREKHFVWSDYVLLTDYYALVSRSDYRNITLHEIRYEKIGLARGTAHANLFKHWFPGHNNTIEYEGIDHAFDALLRGDVDMVMTTQRRLMHLTHFREIVGYKANIVFDQPIETSLVFTKDAAALCSIVDKTLGLIDYDGIAVQWTQRTYDYRVKLIEAQRPLWFGAITLSLAVLALILILFYKDRKEGKRLKKLVEEVNKANQAKSIFLARMSHEIRTPMNAILGTTEIQLQKENHLTDTEEAFNTIYDSGSLLLNIINDILDLSKIEAGKLEIVPYKYDIPSLLNDTIQLNRLRYESKPIEFKLEIDENTPLELYGDELRIKQVINNLLSNAYKYTESGEIELSITFKEVKDANILVIFRVSDTGQGMTEAQIAKLFDEYTRFNTEKNRTVVGAGLGMSITKRLVDMMNGDIFVKSEPGKGSVFTVCIPQKRVSLRVCESDMARKLLECRFLNLTMLKKTQIMREYMPYGSVLVVDDVESNLYVAKGLLHPYGLKVYTASSGQEAIDKIKEGNVYSVILMDHMMPGIDGVEAVRIIRGMQYKNPIVALTANAVTGQADMFLANGFDGFVSKPIDSREFNSMLNSFVRDRQPSEVLEAARKEKEHKISLNVQKTFDGNEFKKVFIHDAEKAIVVLEKLMQKLNASHGTESLDDNDMQLYVVTVHGMKGILANLGENELSNFALKLEQAGRNKKTSEIFEHTVDFITTLKALAVQLKPEQNDALGISDTDKKYLYEKLFEIKKACGEYDVNTAKTILLDLKHKTWPHHVNEALDMMSEHLLHSAFKSVVGIVDDIISRGDDYICH